MRVARALVLVAAGTALGCALVLSGTYQASAPADDGAAPEDAGADTAPPLADAADADEAADAVQPARDVTIDAPPNPCAGTLFCDDFEGPSLDQAQWINLNGDHGDAGVEARHACSGKQSLHVTAAAGTHVGSQSYQLLLAHDDANLPKDVFVRLFVTFENVPDADPVFVLLGTTDARGVQQESQGGKFAGQSYNLTPNASWTDSSGRAIAPMTCACVEFEVDLNKNIVNTWFQGTFSAQAVFAQQIPTPLRLGIGLSFFNATGTIVTDATDQVFIDAVAVSDHRIGCAPVR